MAVVVGIVSVVMKVFDERIRDVALLTVVVNRLWLVVCGLG